jgi:hypothetical protein
MIWIGHDGLSGFPGALVIIIVVVIIIIVVCVSET